MPKFLSLFAFFLALSASQVSAQTLDIATAKAKPAGTTVTFKGIAVNGAELGVIRYVQDNTAGAAVYSPSLSSVNLGDSVEITGSFKDYNGLMEVDPVSSFKVLNSGNTLPQPKDLSLAEAFSEKYEGMLVNVSGVRFVQTGTFSANTNYKVQKGAAQNEVRITTGTDLVGAPIPASNVSVTGIMSQFKTTYQLLPRTMADVAQAGPVLKSNLVQTDITPYAFKLGFSTQKPGNAIIKYGMTPSLEVGTVKDDNMATSHTLGLNGLFPATFYYARAYSIDANGDTSQSQTGYFSTGSLSSGKITVFFNRPIDTTVRNSSPGSKGYFLDKTIDDSLVAFISRATESLEIAIYSFDNNNLSANISAALNAAYSRGVRIRIVTDGGLKNSGIGQLNGNIPVIKSPQGSNYTIMHNKFVVRDAESSDPNVPTVWAGSTNWTDNQIHDDANSVVIIQDEALAKAYKREFEEMFGSTGNTPNASAARFGQFKIDNTPHSFNIGGRLVQLYFSPSDGTNSAILNALNTADKEIYFSQLSFTRSDLAYAIRNKAMDGVFAAGVVNDTAQAGATFNIMKPTLGERLLVYKGTAIYHHKYAIVDPAFPESDPQVVVGSHNWSTAADTKNDENLLIIHDEDVANIYYQEWIKRYFENGGTDTFKRDTTIISAIRPATVAKSAIQLTSCTWNNGQMNVLLDDNKAETVRMQVYDMSGKMITEEKITTVQGETRSQVQTGNIKSGMYILYLRSDRDIASFKLMKF